MSNKVREALFDLIKSMSKSEKRYFKLMSSRHKIGEENNYVRLFDFIEKQDIYSEAELQDHFNGEPFLNKFSITKKRLYDHLLASLDSFHMNSSVEAQLFKMLHSSDILYEKSLYDQSRRILMSAKKLAKKNELNEILLLISKKHKKLLETKGHVEIKNAELEELEELDNRSKLSIELYNRVWKIKRNLFHRLATKGVARSVQEQEVYTCMCVGIIESSDHRNCDCETQYLLNHTLSAYYYAIGDMHNSFVWLQNNLSLFESVKGEIIEFNKQVSAYTNTIYVADSLGFSKEASSFLIDLKKLINSKELNEDLSIKLFSSITSVEYNLFLKKGDFTEALVLAKYIEVQLDLYADAIVATRRAYLEFKTAVVYMGVGDYNTALKWINRILNNSSLDKTEDIVGFTHLLDLLIHIELNHDQLLPYSLKSTQRFFKTRNRMHSFEKVYLHYISRLIKCTDKFDVEQIWEELYNELVLLSNDSFESIALEYFDFKSWAESKLKRKPFKNVIKENYNKNLRTAS